MLVDIERFMNIISEIKLQMEEKKKYIYIYIYN